MLPFKSYGPIDRTERKALVIAGLCCLLFIGFLSVVRSAAPKKRKVVTTVVVPQPITPTKLLEPETPPLKDFNEPYRLVPESFKHVDFKNHSYGLYAYPNAKVIGLKLTEGELELPNDAGWFALEDVYYRDLTGDGKFEALVRLSHVECGVSCDGGADLFYIYTQRNGKLQQLWQYETGSSAYGCALRSFTASRSQLVLEMFGRCSKPGMEDPGATKFVTKDLTYILFKFNGRRFQQTTIQFLDSPPVNVRNYEPPIYIY